MVPIPSKLEGIQAALYGVPWAITEHGMNLITGIVEAHLSGVRLTAEEKQVRAASQSYGSVVDPAEATATKVAVLTLHGPIMSRANDNMMLSGATDPQAFAARVKAAANNPEVARIVISVDSPGGTVSGTATAGDAVAYAATKKDVVVVADDMACSAAYWIAAQASKVVVVPGATVGSIGVVMTIKDTSAKNATEGVKLHVLRSGPLKALGQPGEEIDEKTLEHYGGQLQVFHDQFVAAVAQGRGMTPAQVQLLADGDVWIGQQAVDVGLADEVGTLEQAIRGDFSPAAVSTAQRPAARSPAPRAETTQGGDAMPPEVLAMLGLAPEASAEEVMQAIKTQRAAAAQTERTAILAQLGLKEEDGAAADFAGLAAQASDGRAHREAQLDRLHALTIRAEGNDEQGQKAADDAREVYAGQSLERIAGQITRLEARADGLPDGSLYNEGRDKHEKKAAAPAPLRMSDFGVRRR